MLNQTYYSYARNWPSVIPLALVVAVQILIASVSPDVLTDPVVLASTSIAVFTVMGAVYLANWNNIRLLRLSAAVFGLPVAVNLFVVFLHTGFSAFESLDYWYKVIQLSLEATPAVALLVTFVLVAAWDSSNLNVIFELPDDRCVNCHNRLPGRLAGRYCNHCGKPKHKLIRQ